MTSLRFVISSCSRLGGPAAKFAGGLQRKQAQPTVSYVARFFSNDGDDKKKGSGGEHDDDPFGVNFEDGNEHGKLGPTMPPRYKRDAMTGKFTGEEETETTDAEKKILKMDPVEEQEYILEKVFNDWDLSEEDETGGSQKLSKLAQRVRQDNIGLNTLGRSVEAQSVKGKLEDGEDGFVDETGFSKPLSPTEFKIFQKHMTEEYKTEVDEDDIPVDHATADDSVLGGYADNDYLNTKWMSSKAVRFMDDTKDDDPFSDLLPSDLSPALLVNRRNAKPIPKHLLHHNNLALLRRYVTPTGQIMNRVQSRLGAKDQRKIAKLIKRARALGLLPTAGQFAVEAHGNIYEKDIEVDKDWEKELKRRGLVVKSNKQGQSAN